MRPRKLLLSGDSYDMLNVTVEVDDRRGWFPKVFFDIQRTANPLAQACMTNGFVLNAVGIRKLRKWLQKREAECVARGLLKAEDL